MGGEYHAIIAIARPALLACHSYKPERPQPDHILCPREPSNGAVGRVYRSTGPTLPARRNAPPAMFSFGKCRGHFRSTLPGFPGCSLCGICNFWGSIDDFGAEQDRGLPCFSVINLSPSRWCGKLDAKAKKF
jgi:hypothetical protein